MLASLAVALCPASGAAQRPATPSDVDVDRAVMARAAEARGFRLVVSLADRRLWAIQDDDTLLAARAAVASDAELAYQGKRWRFSMPPGVRPVLRKDSLPVWVPPEWHYYEVAQSLGLAVRHLAIDRPVALGGGRRLVVRHDTVGVVDADARFDALPGDEEIVFGGTLFIPPPGTRNRRIEGELGRYRLMLPDGYSLHGTPWRDSIGAAVTHGCVRLDDADIAWLYEHVPVGTLVYVY